MIKYISKSNKADIRYFEDDANVEEFIDLSEYRLMTDAEIDCHENPLNSLSDEEKEALKISSYPMLTGRQFHLTLVMKGLESTIQEAINAIEDPMQRAIVNIEFSKANDYKRTGTSIIFMQEQMGMSNDELNELWEFGLAIPD